MCKHIEVQGVVQYMMDILKQKKSELCLSKNNIKLKCDWSLTDVAYA